MPRTDRLLTLAGCHVTLRHVGLRCLTDSRAAPTELLAQLHVYGTEIRRLVADGNANVLRALWPEPDVSWQIALLTAELTARLLSVTKGPIGGAHTTLLSLRYDDPEGERRAWRRLCTVLDLGAVPDSLDPHAVRRETPWNYG